MHTSLSDWKNKIAALDRLIGEWVFLRILRFLQPKYAGEEVDLPKDSYVQKYYPGLEGKSKADLYHQSLFESYIRVLQQPVNIDGALGWAYYRKVIPIKYSFPLAEFPWKSYLKPTFCWVQLKLLFKGNVYELDRAVNLLWYGWENYHHFLTDLIPTLSKILTSEYRSLPILVPEAAFSLPFVREFLAIFPYFTELDFHLVPASGIVKVRQQVVFVKASKYLDTINYFKISPFADSIGCIPAKGIEKIFLYRSKRSRRNLSNNEEVIEFLELQGFTCIDTSALSLKDQISTFKSVKVCVGVHGAGLTNLVFAQGEYKLIEILFGGAYQPPHYLHQSLFMHATYLPVKGTDLTKDLVFSVKIDDLKQALDAI